MQRPLTQRADYDMPPELRRALGQTHAIAMVVGSIIGASIFVQPSEVTRQMPSTEGILFVWLAAGVLTLFGALMCAELTTACPQTGERGLSCRLSSMSQFWTSGLVTR